MGYPMTYQRVISRNGVTGDYSTGGPHATIAGDLRRLETDTLDPVHLAGYAKLAGVEPAQAEAIFNAFFHDQPTHATSALSWDEYSELYEALPHVRAIRDMEQRAAATRDTHESQIPG